MDALNHNDCEELEVAPLEKEGGPYYLDAKIISLWKEKVAKGECLQEYDKDPNEIEGYSFYHFPTFFKAFEQYYKDKNWKGVCRIAKYFSRRNAMGTKNHYSKLAEALLELFKQENVSLGLKEIGYHFLKAFAIPNMPSNETYEYLRNHFIEKGDLIRAERLPQP